MYAVSEEFKTAIKSSNRTSSIYGTLTTSDGTQYQLNDSNMIKDSLYVTNQIVNENKLTFGAVYAGECGLVINSTINRYSLFGAKIELTFSLNGEEVPLGIFYVDTPERIGSKIKLTAIDSMSNFDVSVNEDTNGTWYELLLYIANKCKVELAQTQEELEALHVNTTSQTYTIQQDKIDTYRDVLSYLCMIICANATIDNTGKLKIVQYAMSACDSNDRTTRLNNCKFSDYTTRYAGVKCRFFKEENYAPYDAINKDIDGLVIDLGDIPIVGGTVDTKHATVEAMMATINQIEYVPSTLYIASNPAYELGDMIECKDINNTSDSVNTYVMAYKYDYRKKETINCYGDNPLLQNVKDKNNKQFNSIESQLSSKNMIIVNATNAKAITIGQTFDDIVTLNFSVNSECRPICIFTISFSIDVDGYVEFSLYNGMVAMENATYKGYYEAGEHFATFMYLDDMLQNERRSLRVFAKCYADTASVTRVQDARIRTLEKRSSVSAIDIFPQSKGMWEQGSIASADGGNIDSTTRIRSCFVPIKAGQKYKCNADTSHEILTRHYTATKTYRGTATANFTNDDFEFTTDATDKYIRFVVRNSSDATITSDDIDTIYWDCEPVVEVEEVAVDATEPTVTIAELAVRAIAYTQGINGGKGEWNGELEFTELSGDKFGNIPIIANMSVHAYGANVSANVQVPLGVLFDNRFGGIALSSPISIDSFTDSAYAGEIVLDYVFDTTDGEYSEYVVADGAYMMRTEYKYTSAEQSIDSGRMCAVSIDTSPFVSVESVVIE